VIGNKINNYELKRLLGEGGMGAVYVAEHPVLGRRVAIKVLRRELVQDEKLVGRFINEARAADAIRHPNIVQVQDVGLLSDGLPYIVMELLEGQTLGARLQAAGRLGVGETLAIGEQVASAVAAAHNVGIIHRDLKPDNIFLVADPAAPGGQRVKVLDFGIAKLRIEMGGSDLKTKTGAVMGTPAYMSPEQCLGRSGEVDHRTDVYALGVILFEMLCGVPPFVGEGFGEVLVMHMTQPPPPPRSLNPDISLGVEQVILRALSKKKEERFANMGEMGQAIAASARDPNITFSSTFAGPLRAATPVRPSTTLSAAAGSVEPVAGQASQDEMGELRPAGTRRWGPLMIGAGVLAAAAGAFFALPRQAPVAKSGEGEVVRQGAVVAPVVPEPKVPSPPPPSTTAAAVVENTPAVVPEPEQAQAEKADKADKAEKSGGTSKGDKGGDKAEKPDKPEKAAPKGGNKPNKPAKRDKDAAPGTTGRQLAHPPQPELSPRAPSLPSPPPEAPPRPKLEKL
jgi:serine/threonine-protein kinase